jgi:Ca2+-binding RTX toxin-like protein
MAEFIGNSGNDVFTGGDSADRIFGRGGDDTLSGGGGADLIYGEDGSDILYGDDGDDGLNGGAGGDRMEGGLGNDSYTIDTSFDVVVELPGQGIDTVATFFNYTLGAELENLQAADLAGTNPLRLIGNGLSNYIWGNAGANYIDGGAGADRMIGYGGDDTYVVDNVGDIIYEQPGLFAGGTDLVATDISYTLGDNVENLQARIISGTAALALTGNALNNSIWGNDGNNVIDGGAGADFMAGYRGDDFYFVDDAGDRTGEHPDHGTDTVATAISLNLADNIENLQAVDIAGTAALNLSGNMLRNFIWATQGDNIIDGGAGADVMVGYGGNDFYYVDTAGDLVLENAGAGTDTVATFISYTLAANVENLQAVYIGNTDALNLTGNELNNTIRGTHGNNILAGGAGNDTIYSYNGADQILFNTALGATNVDRIEDFVSGTDKILLDNSVFTALVDGALPASAFVMGTAAADADDRIIFNNVDGSLYYDADGNGAGAAILFAVAPIGAVSASDYIVV